MITVKHHYPVYTSTLEQHTPVDTMLFNLYTELQHKSEDSSFALFFRTLADIVQFFEKQIKFRTAQEL